jgi:hypothetical protein
VLVPQKALGSWADNNRRLDLLCTPDDGIRGFRPYTELVQHLGDVTVVPQRLAIDCLQNVAGEYSGFVCGTVGQNLTSLDAVGTLNPGGTVIGRNIAALLLRV